MIKTSFTRKLPAIVSKDAPDPHQALTSGVLLSSCLTAPT